MFSQYPHAPWILISPPSNPFVTTPYPTSQGDDDLLPREELGSSVGISGGNGSPVSDDGSPIVVQVTTAVAAAAVAPNPSVADPLLLGSLCGGGRAVVSQRSCM